MYIDGEADGSIAGKVNNEATDEINYYFSEHVKAQGMKNLDTHFFKDAEFGKRMEWLNSNMGYTKGGKTSYMPSYGF